MANNAKINPMYADTASNARMCNDATVLMIKGIMCIPTNATWVIGS